MSWDELKQRLGCCLSCRRKYLHLTQEVLALEAYVDRAHLRDIENGRVNVSLRILGKIARALHIHYYHLFFLIENDSDFSEHSLFRESSFEANSSYRSAWIFPEKGAGIAENAAAGAFNN
jgi:transcriptional regulator with XRE-family HTH domain